MRTTIGSLLILGCATGVAAQLDDRDGDGTIECCEKGDIFCGVGSGIVEQRDPNTGVLIRMLDTGSFSSADTGMCFDPKGD